MVTIYNFTVTIALHHNIHIFILNLDGNKVVISQSVIRIFQ